MMIELTTTESVYRDKEYKERVEPLLVEWLGITPGANVLPNMEMTMTASGGGLFQISLATLLTADQVNELHEALRGK